MRFGGILSSAVVKDRACLEFVTAAAASDEHVDFAVDDNRMAVL